MTNTERKLDESRYFLNQLNPRDPFFDYILSAFLNAARSTTWIMRFEFGKVTGWEEWFNTCDISDEQKILLKEINDLRVSSTKKAGVKTDFYFLEHIAVDEEYYSVIKDFQKEPDGTEYKITITTPDEPPYVPESENSFQFTGTVKINKDESELSRESIHNLCTEYFTFLQKQVSVCVTKFVKISQK
ncbi:MAG: hypothetical protein WDA22_17620 [Bacteroidota bacterium]